MQFTFTQVQKRRNSSKRQNRASYLASGTASGNTSETGTYGQENGTPQMLMSTPLPYGKPPLPGRGK